MRPVKFLIVFILVFMLVVSCHKDTGNTNTRLVQSMSIDGNPCVINCLYDALSRVTSVTQCDTVETYTYYSDSIIYVRRDNSGFRYKYVYHLTSSGLAAGYTRIANDGSVTEYILDYDANENRIRATDTTHGNTFVAYTIQNNNAIDDSSVSAVTISGSYTISRTFYANTENTIGYANFGKNFLGRSSANFKKSENYNTPDGLYTVQYTYQLDYLNGVSKRVMKVNDSIIESRHYTYY